MPCCSRLLMHTEVALRNRIANDGVAAEGSDVRAERAEAIGRYPGAPVRERSRVFGKRHEEQSKEGARSSMTQSLRDGSACPPAGVSPDALASLILVVGAPRSGTTWLAKIIDSHPDVLYRHEPDETLPGPATLTGGCVAGAAGRLGCRPRRPFGHQAAVLSQILAAGLGAQRCGPYWPERSAPPRVCQRR